MERAKILAEENGRLEAEMAELKDQSGHWAGKLASRDKELAEERKKTAAAEKRAERAESQIAKLSTTAKNSSAAVKKLGQAQARIVELEAALNDVQKKLERQQRVLNKKQQQPREPAPAPAPAPARAPARAPATREAKARLIFEKFDRDKDGLHNLDESRALGRALEGVEGVDHDVSEDDFKGLCTDLGADPKRGLSLAQFTRIYTDAAFGARIEVDYRKIFGKAT